MPRLNNPANDGDTVHVTIIDPLPDRAWVCDLLPDVVVWLVKEARPAFVVLPIVMLEEPGQFRLHMQDCQNGQILPWDMDLMGRGRDGSQLISPCNNWEPSSADQVDGVPIIDSVHHQYDLLAWLYEQFTDKPFPGFRHGQLPEVAEAALTRNLRRSEARANKTLPKVVRDNLSPLDLRETPPENMAEHPDLPVPYEVSPGEMTEEVVATSGEPIGNREARGEATDGDDGTYRVG